MNTPEIAHERARRLLVVTAVCLPAALYVLYVWHYSFDLPFGDDWTKAPLMADALRNHIDFARIWEQHTEARLVLPNLLFVAIGRPVRFNIQVLVLTSAATLVVAWLALVRLARDYVARPLTWLPVLVLGVVWFSLADTGNSLWAFQLAWYLVIFFLVLMLWFLLAWPFGRTWGLALATVCAIAAALSMVQGFLLWPVGILCLLWAWERGGGRAQVVALVGWLGVAVVTAAAYFFHYNTGAGCTNGMHCSMAATAERPVHSSQFFTAVVGYVVPKIGPFGRQYVGLHQWLGLALCIAAAFVIVQSVRERRRGPGSPLALALVVFALLFDGVLTVTRGGGLAVLASQSRFTMPNIVLVSGIVLYAWAHAPRLDGLGGSVREGARLAGVVVVGVFVVMMTAFTTSSGIQEGRSWHAIQVTEARVLVNRLTMAPGTYNCYFSIYVTNGSRGPRGNVSRVERWVSIARHHHLYVFTPTLSAKYRRIGPPEVPDICHKHSATDIVPLPGGGD